MSNSSKVTVENMVGRSVDVVGLEQFDLPPKPYLPFPVAMARKIIDFSAINVRSISEQIGAAVGNGRVPQQNDAGLVETSDGLLAVDHVQIFPTEGNKLAVAPSGKGEVDKRTGHILGPGFGVVTHPDEGWLDVIAVIEDAAKHPWAEFISDSHRVGGLIVRQLSMFDRQRVEIDEITDSGIVVAKPYKRIY